VPVEMAAKGFLAFLLMDSRGAEGQQTQTSNYQDDWEKTPTNQQTANNPTPLHSPISGSFSRIK